ncbi:MAG TPA: phosphatidylserine/phosphatidylglycerophosphate/cardiolipin synthase family protein [Isosphaeraceae bacterium]|jgi:cardiolipin synthase|nr:phosphatidylserine/phosphatidylglycerophosphate/cardiolipin synthase family protein [Isosphaeraceae bacterium]
MIRSRVRSGIVVAVSVAVAPGGYRAEGGEHGRRGPVPPNAVQPPGASFEGYPAVGRSQKVEIAREAVGATVAGLAQNPVQGTGRLLGRTAERLGTRGQEVVRAFAFDGPLPPGDCPLAPRFPGRDLGDAGGPPTPATLTLIPDSDAAVQALLGIIATARSRVDLVLWGWEDDPTGREVAAALAERARAGVAVRLLVDRTGFLVHNAAAARGEPTFLDRLACVPNVRLIEEPGTDCRFDHRKVAVVDDRVAWSGSMILTEVARRRWHNFAFLAEGPIVAQYARLFADRWAELGGPPAPRPCPPATSPAPNAVVRMVRTDVNERSLRDAVYNAVDHAQRRIVLENPYFSDRILAEKLVDARRRGVAVVAILTLRGNIRAENQFEALMANRLLRAGAEVYLYPAMTHVKAMSVDGAWAYFGTGNFDELSLRNNREVSLTTTTPSLVAELDRVLFAADAAASERLTAPLPPPPIGARVKLALLALWY